jgi:hypothetical protein
MTEELTDPQLEAVRLLLGGARPGKVAERLGVTRATLWRWRTQNLDPMTPWALQGWSCGPWHKPDRHGLDLSRSDHGKRVISLAHRKLPSQTQHK